MPSVVFHHPLFNVGAEAYEEQHIRVLALLFEAHEIDFVLSGHQHNYHPHPFGTFFAMGAAITATAGPALVDWYTAFR
jgi:hypothetical protein